jgi:hypothetical protein
VQGPHAARRDRHYRRDRRGVRGVRPVSNLATAEAMIAAYNAQDVDTYVSYMTDDACEANYRGAVLREGREGTRVRGWPQLSPAGRRTRPRSSRSRSSAITCCSANTSRAAPATDGLRTGRAVRRHRRLFFRGRQVLSRGVHPVIARELSHPRAGACCLRFSDRRLSCRVPWNR